jgi:hypothetical protein
MLNSIIQSAAAGWIGRRVQELGSIAAMLVPVYLAMPQEQKDSVHAIFTGQGGGLTVSAVIGLAWYLWAQWQSYRATVKPQVVTGDGQKIAIAPNTRAASEIEARAAAARKPPRTLWDRLTGK